MYYQTNSVAGLCYSASETLHAWNPSCPEYNSEVDLYMRKFVTHCLQEFTSDVPIFFLAGRYLRSMQITLTIHQEQMK